MPKKNVRVYSIRGEIISHSWRFRIGVYALRIDDLVALAQSRVAHSLTTEECQKYLHMEACPSAP